MPSGKLERERSKQDKVATKCSKYISGQYKTITLTVYFFNRIYKTYIV